MMPRDWMIAAAIMGGITTACTLFYNTGFGGIYPINDRLAWLTIFSAFTSIGFFTTPFESEMIALSPNPPKRAGLLLSMAGLFPFMLVAVFFGALSSTSGMIGALQGIAALAFVLACGPLVHATCKNKFLTSVFQAFLLQLITSPQGALFALFA